MAGETIANSISIGKQNAYITWQNSGVTAYDLRVGSKLWTINFDGSRAYATGVADEYDNVYVAKDTQITAYDADGNTLWVFEDNGVIKSLLQNQGRLFFYQEGVVKALSTKSNAVEWQVQFAGKWPMLVYSNYLLAPGKGELLALDRDTGLKLWATSFSTTSYLQTPAIFGDNVYVES